MGTIWPKNDRFLYADQLQTCSKDHFKILHNERGQEVLEGHVIGFSEEKKFVLCKSTFITFNLSKRFSKICRVKVDNRCMKKKSHLSAN